MIKDNTRAPGLTDAQKIAAVERYRAGETTVEIAADYGCTPSNIRSIIVRRGVTLRNKNVYPLNHAFFDELTPDGAYILGMLGSDGYHDERRWRVSLGLAERDIDILVKIKAALGLGLAISHKASPRVTQIRGRAVVGGPSNQLRFTSRQIGQQLVKYGIVRRKSLTFDLPDLPPHLFMDFLRGYIDGDGSVIYSRKNNRLRFILCATWSFCEKVKEILSSRHGIASSISKTTTPQIFHLEVSSNNALQLGKLLYDGAHLSGDRKRTSYEKAIRLIVQNKGYRRIKAVSLSDGVEQVFPSQVMAASALSVKQWAISAICHGEMAQTNGYRFEFVENEAA